jgi:hypothetical protein
LLDFTSQYLDLLVPHTHRMLKLIALQYLSSGRLSGPPSIHGTNEPETIGQAISSGCFRLVNDDVADLYDRVSVGTHVIVRHHLTVRLVPPSGSLHPLKREG